MYIASPITYIFYTFYIGIRKLLPLEKEILVSGLVDEYKNNKQITHPDHIVNWDNLENLPKVEATYSLTQGLTNRVVRTNIQKLITNFPKINEWHDAKLLKKNKWPSFSEAIKVAHNPKTDIDLTSLNPSKERLPVDGGIRPIMILIKVDLPEPVWPVKPIFSPL